MNSFVETISPAAKNHIEARLDYYKDLTFATLQSMRKLAEVNTQFSHAWLQDSTDALRTALLTPPSANSRCSGGRSGIRSGRRRQRQPELGFYRKRSGISSTNGYIEKYGFDSSSTRWTDGRVTRRSK